MALQGNNHPRRITSLFGTYLPPRKEKKALKHLTVSFLLLGTIPSKKNLLWAASNWHFVKKIAEKFSSVKKCIDFLSGETGLKVYIQNSTKYTSWVSEQTPIVVEQSLVWAEKFEKYGLKFPLTNVTIKVYHYWNDKMERDLTNKLDSIADLLVSAGIIENDSWQVLSRIHSEGEYYGGEILQSIARIDITQSFYE